MRAVVMLVGVAAVALSAGCTRQTQQSDQARATSAQAPYHFSAGSDRSGKGAVVCAWWLYVGAEQIGETCVPGQDREFKAELARSIARVESFIIENNSTPVTQAQLDANKAGQRRVHSGTDICKGDGLMMYQVFRDAGPSGLRTSVDELLSVPREPVADPCV